MNCCHKAKWKKESKWKNNWGETSIRTGLESPPNDSDANIDAWLQLRMEPNYKYGHRSIGANAWFRLSWNGRQSLWHPMVVGSNPGDVADSEEWSGYGCKCHDIWWMSKSGFSTIASHKELWFDFCISCLPITELLVAFIHLWGCHTQ